LTIGIITALKIVIDFAASSPCRWISWRIMGHVTVALYTNLRCLQY